jgi:hypothetical protein
MSVAQKTTTKTSDLVDGIVDETQALFLERIQLFKLEMQRDLAQARTAAVSFLIGWGCCMIAGILLGLMLTHLLQWLMPAVPLWVCYLIVGVPLAGVSGGMLYLALERFKAIEPPSISLGKENENGQ